MGVQARATEFIERLAGAVNRALFRFGLRGGLKVTARITYPIGRTTIAIGGEIGDIALMGAHPVAAPSLCIEVENIGLEEVTVTEVGLTGGEEGPQIPMIDPLLHDNGGWPRRLMPPICSGAPRRGGSPWPGFDDNASSISPISFRSSSSPPSQKAMMSAGLGALVPSLRR